jgi:hypothetical protein
MDLCQLGADPDLHNTLQGTLFRVVESQEQIATTALVDDLNEQALLEDMLEATKPPRLTGTESLHYLLATPFRYPPLRHGSRFGVIHEPSLFYGSHQVTTALTETAYYRFVFWQGIALPPPSGRLVTQHTAFSARYRTTHGLRLQSPPFDVFESELRDPRSYSATQPLGTAMRTAGVQAFEFLCARTRRRTLNAALFKPRALVSRKPLDPHPLVGETRAEQVSFRASSGSMFQNFPLSAFLVDGLLPLPGVLSS